MKPPRACGGRGRAVGRALLAMTLLAAACSPADDGAAGDDHVGRGDAGPIRGEVVVFAAASLTDAFEELSDRLADRHPALEVVVNHAGSQVLAGQIIEGAPADVFASADHAQMRRVTDAGLTAGDPQVFAINDLVIAVEPGNPLGIDGLDDLAAPEVVLVLPAPEVPAGTYARAALERAGTEVQPSSLERDVRAALAKVALGEADAAIVYASDVVAAGGRVDGVALPARHAVRAEYPAAVLADAPNPDAARVVVEHLLGPDGRRVLERHGFGTP